MLRQAIRQGDKYLMINVNVENYKFIVEIKFKIQMCVNFFRCPKK